MGLEWFPFLDGHLEFPNWKTMTISSPVGAARRRLRYLATLHTTMKKRGFPWVNGVIPKVPFFWWDLHSIYWAPIGNMYHLYIVIIPYTTCDLAFWKVICYLPPIKGNQKQPIEWELHAPLLARATLLGTNISRLNRWFTKLPMVGY